MTEFSHATPVTVSLQVQRGTAEVVAEERDTVTVDIAPDDGRFTVALDGDTLIVHSPEGGGFSWRRGEKADVKVRVPLDSSLAVRSAAADLRLAGRYTTANVNAASASLHLDHVTGDAHIKAASGDLTADRVGGSLRIHTSSGELVVGDVTGDVNATTASGDITIRRAGASLKAESASGDVEVGSLIRGKALVKTASGDVTVGVTPGTGVWLDLDTASGKTTSDLAMPSDVPANAATLELKIRTASGHIDVHRAMGDLPAAA